MHSLEAIELYAQFHPQCFESVRQYKPSHDYTDIYSKIIPGEWQLQRNGFWFFAAPPQIILPDQGWKLHISVRTDDAEMLLLKALPIIFEETASFKFLLDPLITSLVNGKLWSRSSSGKFITIYPASLDQFYRLGYRLSEELHAFVGPYILSDRRWPDSKVVHYRYGGFSARSLLQLDGTRNHVIAAPDGELVPDLRLPYWHPPAWAKNPFSADMQQLTPELTLDGGRFSITTALSFSNRGGVYKGIDNHTGQEVVIKEARPHVEIGRHRLEALTLIEKEFHILKRLADTKYFVQPVRFFRSWEHAFLVEEFIPGDHLGRFIIRNSPLYSGTVTNETVDVYFDQMRQIWIQLVRAIEGAHNCGFTLGDLSFTNILVNEGQIKICDLETALEQGEDVDTGLHTPGMSASGISEQANDYYALGAIMLGSIVLVHGFTGFYQASRSKFLNELTNDLGLPSGLATLINDLMDRSEYFKMIPELIIKSIEQIPFGISTVSRNSPRLSLPIEQRFDKYQRLNLRNRVSESIDAIVRYLHNVADTVREDRLFPADLWVFETNPLSVAYGSGGVLYALHCLRGEVPPHLVEWMLQRTPLSSNQYPPGLYLGQAGISWVMSELGYSELAVKIMRSARKHDMLWKSPNVLHGASGYGLACLKLWEKGLGNEFLDAATQVGQYLLVSCVRDERGTYWPNESGSVSVGYAHGGSGISLFLLYLSLATENADWLQLGRQALDFDLAQGVWLDGKFSGFPGSITDVSESPNSAVIACYWDSGSAGVGTTLVRYLAVTSDPTLHDWLDSLIVDANRKYTSYPQLFRGLAGLGNFLLDVWNYTNNQQHLLAAWQVAEGILLFQIDREEGAVFPGEQTRRESADFATGSAGVGLFLNRLLRSEKSAQGNFNFVVDELLS